LSATRVSDIKNRINKLKQL